MTHLLSAEEVSEFREIFNLVDRDGGGSITKEELGELMDTLGIDASPEEVDLMIREVGSIALRIIFCLHIFCFVD